MSVLFFLFFLSMNKAQVFVTTKAHFKRCITISMAADPGRSSSVSCVGVCVDLVITTQHNPTVLFLGSEKDSKLSWTFTIVADITVLFLVGS